MKYAVLTLTAFLAVPLLAAPVDCASGSLADYIALGSAGCRLGSFVVSEFSETSITGTATRIPSADITIKPSFNVNSGSLQFLADLSTATAFLENRFLYSVSGPLTFAALSLEDATAAGNGATLVTGELCGGGNYSGGFCPSNEFVQAVFQVDGVQDLRAFTNLGRASSLAVRQSISVDAGPLGQALFASSTATFGTPEPASLLMLASGATLLFGRRLVLRRKRANVSERS